MSPNRDDFHDERLTRLMAQYDEVLAAESSADLVDDTELLADPALATAWVEAKSCLELLHRARQRRQSIGSATDVADVRNGEPAAADSGPPRIGRFAVQREIGRGGLGVVFQAYDPRADRMVAIKIPRFAAFTSEDLRRRFLREAKAAARLNHPNLVTLHEVGEDGPICYLASELCSGPTLARWLRDRSNPVVPRVAALLVRQLAEGVQHAHSRGVLHRDIKPGNVLLVEGRGENGSDDDRDSGNLTPKLTDFGMAKLLESTDDETRSGTIVGTLAYMSPEQAEGRVDELDATTDVYALGAILYELMGGVPPFRGRTEIETLRLLATSEPATLRQVRPDVPRDLEAIAQKCLQKNPALRYATAQELADDLSRFLHNEPTLARPLTSPQRLGKWIRRRPATAASLLVITGSICALAFGNAMYTVRLRRHAQELTAATAARDLAQTLVQSHAHELEQEYDNDIRMAYDAWKDGRIAESNHILTKHQPGSNGADHRTLPWQFLWHLGHLESTPLKGHQGAVFVARYAPSGDLLATAGEDGAVCLWDTSVGTLASSWRAHGQEITALTFSPDGRWLATAAGGDGAAVWEVASGRLVRWIENRHPTTMAIAFSPDSKSLVTGSDNGQVTFINTDDWADTSIYVGPPAPVCLIAFAQDGKLLATTGGDNNIRLWRREGLKPIGILEGHKREITSIAVSHDGRQLGSTSRDGTARIWDLERRLLTDTYEGRSYLYDIAFNSDDQQVVIAGQTGAAYVWDRRAGQVERVLRRGGGHVFSVSLARDDRQIATAGADEMVCLWQGPLNPVNETLITRNSGRLTVLSPDARSIVVGDHFGALHVYDAADGRPLKQLVALSAVPPKESPVNALCFSNQGDLLAAAMADHNVRVWTFPGLVPLHSFDKHINRVWHMRFSPDDKLLATCGHEGKLYLCDARSGEHARELPTEGDIIRSFAFSPDGRLLLGGGMRRLLYLWDVAAGELVAKLDGHNDDIMDVAWAPDGKLATSSQATNRILVWNMQKLVLVRQIVPNQRDAHVVFAPDGKTLVCFGKSRAIKMWDLSTGEQLLALEQHQHYVDDVVFSPRGDFFISANCGKPFELIRWPARQ